MEQPPSPTSSGAPARAGLRARRAAAARRRALLTVILLVLTAGTGVLAAATAVSGWFVLAPAVLLVATLALGRRAVRANARADAAWEARDRARRAAAQQRLAGRPASAVRPQVTGHAVKSSQVQTQMIARVRPLRTPGAGSAPADTSTDTSADTSTSTGAGAGVVSATDDAPVDATAPDAPASVDDTPTPQVADLTARPTPDAVAATATEWVSVPVPRPVYTLKSPAPRWEPAPLTAEMAQIAQARRDELAAHDAARPAASGTLTSAATGTDAPSGNTSSEGGSDSLGVNLNAVLARRRAAGE